MIIAIDGPSAAGKGTLARRLAQKLELAYLDTGTLYRSVAALMLEDNAIQNSEDAAFAYALKLTPEIINFLEADNKLRTPQASKLASVVAAYPKVRKALFDFQRGFPETHEEKGSVLDGRDIGTSVFPDADYKFFITASAEVRAQRRFLELEQKGVKTSYQDVLKETAERDLADVSRKTNPLKPAADAIIIDTSDMTEDEVFTTALKHIKGRSWG